MSWRILLVDDDPLIRSLVTSHLADHSATVVEYDAAEPALEDLLENTYDLLITDLGLSGARDGIWLLNQTREHRAELPIIVITGAEPEWRAVRAADVVVLKPFHPDELLGEVLELLGT